MLFLKPRSCRGLKTSKWVITPVTRKRKVAFYKGKIPKPTKTRQKKSKTRLNDSN